MSKLLAILAISGGFYTCQPTKNDNPKPDGVTHAVPDAGSSLGFLAIALASVLTYRRFKS